MKRALATLGVAGIVLLSVPAPAYAANDVKICHNGHVVWVNIHAVDGPSDHAGHPDDIISPEDLPPYGLNWTPQGIETYENSCVPKLPVPPGEEHPPSEEQPPGEEHPPVKENPPVKEEPKPELEQPALAQTPVTLTPAPQVAAPQVTAPKAAAPKGAVTKAPAPVSRGTNQGFNAQTAVGGSEQNGTWLAGLAVLAGAGAVVAVRRTTRLEAPTAG